MKYNLIMEPYERENEEIQTTISFNCTDDIEAKLKMCSLFYGYESIPEMYKEMGFPESDSRDEFLKYLMSYVDSLNGDDELDYFVTLTREDGDLVWGAKNKRIEEDYI